MSPQRHKVEITATEFPHFRRLVDFLQQVEDYARVTADEELLAIVEKVRADLAEM